MRGYRLTLSLKSSRIVSSIIGGDIEKSIIRLKDLENLEQLL